MPFRDMAIALLQDTVIALWNSSGIHCMLILLNDTVLRTAK